MIPLIEIITKHLEIMYQISLDISTAKSSQQTRATHAESLIIMKSNNMSNCFRASMVSGLDDQDNEEAHAIHTIIQSI